MKRVAYILYFALCISLIIGAKNSKPTTTTSLLAISDKNSTDYHPCITPSGNIYFGSDRDRSKGSFDIWLAIPQHGNNFTITNLNINTGGFESHPSLTIDENIMLFCKYDFNEPDRKKKKTDIFITKRINNKWEQPHRLKEVSSPANDTMPSISPTGRFFLFVSDRNGNDDIFIAIKEKGKYKVKRANINSTSNDTSPFIAWDGKTILFISDRSGKKQIYKTVLKENYSFSKPIIIKSNIHPSTISYDIIKETLYFTTIATNISSNDNIYTTKLTLTNQNTNILIALFNLKQNKSIHSIYYYGITNEMKKVNLRGNPHIAIKSSQIPLFVIFLAKGYPLYQTKITNTGLYIKDIDLKANKYNSHIIFESIITNIVSPKTKGAIKTTKIITNKGSIKTNIYHITLKTNYTINTNELISIYDYLTLNPTFKIVLGYKKSYKTLYKNCKRLITSWGIDTKRLSIKESPKAFIKSILSK